MINYDYINDDGDKMKKKGSTDINISTIYECPGSRKTENTDILAIEHEVIESQTAIENPAAPLNDDVEISDAVTDTIAALDPVAAVREFLNRESKYGPRKYVVALANQRLAELKRRNEDEH